MPELIKINFLVQIIEFIINNKLFDFAIVSLSVYVFYLIYEWGGNYKEWSEKLENINLNKKNLKKSKFEEYEEELKSLPRLNTIMTPLREFAQQSKGMTVTEIHSIAEEKILEPESKISTYSSGFLLIGFLWTLYGIFMAMSISFTEIKEIEMLTELVGGFRISFSSTFIGIVFFMLGNLGNLYVRKHRESFFYNLVLYVKHVFLPIKGIPDVQHKLGSLVRSLEDSSSTLKECSESIVKLSQSAQSDSETILLAIDGFRDVTSEMSKREASLTSIFEHQSGYFESIRSTLKGIENPINELAEQIANRDIKIAEEIGIINKIHDLQSQLQVTATKALEMIGKSEVQMASFFGEKFPKVLDKAIENFNNLHSKELTSIINNVEQTSSQIDKGFEQLTKLTIEMDEDITGILNSNERMNQSISNIISDLKGFQYKIDELFNPENNEKLKEIYLSSQAIDSISLEVKAIKNSMNFFEGIPGEIEKMTPAIIQSLQKSFTKLENKINKISTTSYSLFGSKQSNEKK